MVEREGNGATRVKRKGDEEGKEREREGESFIDKEYRLSRRC